MKKFQLLVLLLAVGVFSAQAQLAEEGPYAPAPAGDHPEALFDFLFNIDVGSGGAIGADGQAGVAFINDQYWVSTWASDTIHILDNTGAFLSTIVIPGVSGTRSMTTDGTNVYIGTAGTDIYVVDPITMMATSIINISPSTDATARMVTYDADLDGGSGGFWCGNFSSDIASYDMSGNELSVIPLGTHNTVVYGGAVDVVSTMGPALYIHSQQGTAPARDFIVQLDYATGAPTGVIYDYTVDSGSTEVLAGGLFITDQLPTHNNWAFVGLCQCSPSNVVFGLEIDPALGVGENSLSDLAIVPNPASGSRVTIQTALAGEMQVAVFDVLGKQVINTTINNRELDIAGLTAGVYMVQVTQNNNTAVKKLVVK